MTAFCENVVSNIDTAMDTVLAAHPLGMVVAGIPELDCSPRPHDLQHANDHSAR